MKTEIQTIKQNGRVAFVVLPINEYNKLRRSTEDLDDLRAVEDFLENPSELFPMDIAVQLADGKNPIKVFRAYRNMTQSTLASKIQVSKQYISQLENGEREGGVRLMKKIANTLKVDLDDLVS